MKYTNTKSKETQVTSLLAASSKLVVHFYFYTFVIVQNFDFDQQ